MELSTAPRAATSHPFAAGLTATNIFAIPIETSNSSSTSEMLEIGSGGRRERVRASKAKRSTSATTAFLGTSARDVEDLDSMDHGPARPPTPKRTTRGSWRRTDFDDYSWSSLRCSDNRERCPSGPWISAR